MAGVSAQEGVTQIVVIFRAIGQFFDLLRQNPQITVKVVGGVVVCVLALVGLWPRNSVPASDISAIEYQKIAAGLAFTQSNPHVFSHYPLSQLHAKATEACAVAFPNSLSKQILDEEIQRVLDHLRVAGPLTIADVNDLLGGPISAREPEAARQCRTALVLYQAGFPCEWQMTVALAGEGREALERFQERAALNAPACSNS